MRKLLARLAIVAAALSVVEVVVRAGLVNQLFIAPPSSAVATAASQLVGGGLGRSLLVTLYEAAAAFVLASVIGSALGYLLWRSRRLTEAYEPWVAGLFATPLILLYPIPLVLFGRTSAAVIAEATVTGVLPVILYTIQGLTDVAPDLLKVAAVHRLTRWQTLRHVLAPAAAPTLVTGLRLGTTYILISVVAMEYLAQIGGLGRVVNEQYLRFDMPQVHAAVLVVVVITALLLYLTGRIEAMVRR